MQLKKFTFQAFMLVFCLNATGQNSVPRTLLPESIVDELIGEASGERAMNHIIEMGAYIHDRPASEYSGYFYETEYVVGKLKEYGLEDIAVNKYPVTSPTWDGVEASIWEISPGRSKIADYQDLPAVLASGSNNADVKAELVWVGEGREEDIDKAGVEGKIAVTSGSISMVHALAVAKGAEGVISYDSPRPLQAPLAIPITGIGRRGGQTTAKFGFFLPPREGTVLRDRLLAGEKITVHAVVKVEYLDYDLEVPACIIRGTDPAAGEIIFSAHIFEGFVKMGANDNISGSAAILEIARMLNTMISEKRIERPKRTIRFIWIPEFSGTGPWVIENKELMKKTLCNINLDMVGLNLKENQSFFCLHRTTYGNPHYLNDVMENYYHFTGLGNRAGLAVSGRAGFVKRIVAMTGSDDPFYYSIDDHYGSSDHEVFNDWGVQVPGIMMITWPDFYYHTSQDLADKCDPTQLKRVCFIGAAAALTIAGADEAMACTIAGEVAGNASVRIGKQLTRAINELGGSSKEDFINILKKTRGYIEAAVINEKATLETTSELVPNSETFRVFIAKLSESVDGAGNAALAAFGNYAEKAGTDLGITDITIRPTALENRASGMRPLSTSLVTERGYRGYAAILSSLDTKVREKYAIKSAGLDTQELGRLCNGKNTALDIKKLLDSQGRREADLQDVINYIYLLREAGLVSL